MTSDTMYQTLTTQHHAVQIHEQGLDNRAGNLDGVSFHLREMPTRGNDIESK